VDLEASAPGTAFVCTMPASVVSTMGLLVEAGGACYALPIEHVRRSLRVRHAELEEHRAGLVPIPDEEPLRIVPLTGLMGWGVRGTAAGRQRSVVVLDVNGARLGVVVDAVRGQTEYVSQPLPYNYEGVPAVRGAVIQSDGSVALALDVPELFDLAHGQRAHASTPTAPQQQRVLVVDDSVSVRTLERDHLQAAGYDVAVAADGQQAWETLQEGSFDLVISDVQMPVLDGLSLTRRIRDDARFADLPVILVSRLGSAADRAASADAGADAYLVKGRFEQQSLVDLVGSYLRSAAAPGPA
jgi:two-component system chemotaxis sensor kinase CheA